MFHLQGVLRHFPQYRLLQGPWETHCYSKSIPPESNKLWYWPGRINNRHKSCICNRRTMRYTNQRSLLVKRESRAFFPYNFCRIMSGYVIANTCCASQNLNPEVRVQNSVGYQNRRRAPRRGMNAHFWSRPTFGSTSYSRIRRCNVTLVGAQNSARARAAFARL